MDGHLSPIFDNFSRFVLALVRTKSCPSTAGNVLTNSLQTANLNFTSTERRVVTSFRESSEIVGCSRPAPPSLKEKICFTELCRLIRLNLFVLVSVDIFTFGLIRFIIKNYDSYWNLSLISMKIYLKVSIQIFAFNPCQV